MLSYCMVRSALGDSCSSSKYFTSHKSQPNATAHFTLTLHNQTPDPAGTSVTLKPSLILVRLTAGIPGPQGGISIRYCTAASPVPAHWRKAGKWKVKSANTTALESARLCLNLELFHHSTPVSSLHSRLSTLEAFNSLIKQHSDKKTALCQPFETL